MIERAVKERRHRPICIVDLAVPRDVEAEVSRLDDVYVYSMDELGAVVESGKESRKAAVVKAEVIISMRVQAFEKWLEMRAAVPAIARIRNRAEKAREELTQKAIKQIEKGAAPAVVIDLFGKAFMHKLLHDPTVLLRNAEGLTSEEREHMTMIVGHFFGPR